MPELKQMLILFFHVVTFGIYIGTLIYDSFFLTALRHQRSYGGRFKFLTYWNELIQTFFFGYSIINDIFGSNKRQGQVKKKSRSYNDDKSNQKSSLQQFRDTFAATVVFPTGLFVEVTFWGLYAIDREIIFPKALDAVIPAWLNHVWHTGIVFFLAIEKFAIFHQYPTRKKGLLYSVGFILIYLIWILWIAFHAGIWVYPIFDVLSWPLRVAFLLVCAVLFVLGYFVGEKLTQIFWGRSSQTGTTKVD